MSPPVLVTGGSGTVGRAVVARLIEEGRTVRALARSRSSADALRAIGAEPVGGDVLDRASLAAAMTGCSTVFHLAGVNAMCLRDPSSMLRTNVEGSVNVVRAAAEMGVDRVVNTSSASALGEPPGTVGREDSPHRGSYLSEYERSKHAAEQRVAELAPELGIAVVTVNPSSVQGPGRSTGSARLLLEVVNGRMPLVVDTWISIVDIADCAQGHLLAETRGRPGERYVLSGVSITTREAVELLERIWGLSRPVRFAPRWIASAAGWVAWAASTVTRRDPPICPETVRTLLHGHRYDGSRATRELGLRYTPIEDTLLRTLLWFAERGLVPQARADRPNVG